MEDPYAATTASHLLLMLVTNLATFCCGMASHSSMRNVSQRGSAGHSKTYSTPKLIPQMFNWVEVWTHGRPFHPLHSHILEVLSDDPGSVGASVVILEDGSRSHIPKIWDRHWLQNLVPIPLCVEVSLNDSQVCLASDRDPSMSPPKGVTLSVQQSA